MVLSKKGSGITDLFVWIITTFAISVIVVLMLYGFGKAYIEMENKIPSMQGIMSSEDNMTAIFQGTMGATMNSFEVLKWATGAIIVGMIIAILISGYLIKVNKVFVVLYLLIVIISFIVAVELSNVYEIIYSNPELASTFTGFFAQNYIMLNLPIWLTVLAFMYGILMFIDFPGSGGAGVM